MYIYTEKIIKSEKIKKTYRLFFKQKENFVYIHEKMKY